MRRTYLIVVCMMLCIVGWANEDLPRAFRTGDAQAIGMQMDQTVQIYHLDDVHQYSKNEATLFLSRFFSKNDPTSYEVVHNGKSRGASHYTIGNLVTNSGHYRIYVYFSEDSNRAMIKELRIDRRSS